MTLCGDVAPAQHRQKQAAYDSPSWLDWEIVRVTHATTDTKTQQGSDAQREHRRMSTSTHTHARDVEADDMNSYQRDTDLTFWQAQNLQHGARSQSYWSGHTMTVGAASCDGAPSDGVAVVTQCPWGWKPEEQVDLHTEMCSCMLHLLLLHLVHWYWWNAKFTVYICLKGGNLCHGITTALIGIDWRRYWGVLQRLTLKCQVHLTR